MNRLFTYLIVGSMVLGIGVGWALNVSLSAEGSASTWTLR